MPPISVSESLNLKFSVKREKRGFVRVPRLSIPETGHIIAIVPADVRALQQMSRHLFSLGTMEVKNKGTDANWIRIFRLLFDFLYILVL